MKCKDYCKHFKTTGLYGKGGGFGEITESHWMGRCKKYNIQTSTEDDCLDTLPYNEK